MTFDLTRDFIEVLIVDTWSLVRYVVLTQLTNLKLEVIPGGILIKSIDKYYISTVTYCVD